MTFRSGYLPALSAKVLWLVVLLVIRECGSQFYRYESDAGDSGKRRKNKNWSVDGTEPERL